MAADIRNVLLPRDTVTRQSLGGKRCQNGPHGSLVASGGVVSKRGGSGIPEISQGSPAGRSARVLGCLAVLVVTAVFFAPPAAAQFGPSGGSENRAWQFLSPNDRAARIGNADFYERFRGGFYRFAPPTYNFTTNVAGDQYNCDVSAVATGNTAGTSVTGTSGAPTVLNNPSLQATSTGNAGTQSADLPLNAGSTQMQSDQANTGSTQTSGVTGSTIGGVSGPVAGSSNDLAQRTTTSQSALNSPQTATITSSTACATGYARR